MIYIKSVPGFRVLVLSVVILLQSVVSFTQDVNEFPAVANMPIFHFESYKVKGKVKGWGVLAFAGLVDGVLEGYQFDGRKSFERKFNVRPTGFFGSESWRSVYVNGDPAQGFRNEFVKNTGAFDFYHIADDFRKLGYVTGGISLGIGGAKINTKRVHYLYDFLIAFSVSALTKRLGMQWVRN